MKWNFGFPVVGALDGNGEFSATTFSRGPGPNMHLYVVAITIGPTTGALEEVSCVIESPVLQ